MPAASRLAGLFGRRPAAGEDDPFDGRLFSRLDRMRLRVSRAHGRRSGATPVRGLTQESGIEVESFKTYTPGDDIRYVDWNAVARIDQLLTRRFVAEREVPVHVLLDASASMGLPSRDRKFFCGVRLAAALGYIALNNNDPVRVATLKQRGAASGAGSVPTGAGAPAGTRPDADGAESPLLRHRGRYLRLKPLLTEATTGGRTVLLQAVDRYLERHRERGIAFVISDFLVPPADYEAALTRLVSRKFEVDAIHVVGPEERNVERLGGRLRLRDAETGAAREIAVSSAERRRYAEAFAERGERLRSFCHRSGVGYALVDSGDTMEHSLTKVLASAGMLRIH